MKQSQTSFAKYRRKPVVQINIIFFKCTQDERQTKKTRFHTATLFIENAG